MPESRITLRLPEHLHKRIKQAAERNHRSLNQELVYRLQSVRENADDFAREQDRIVVGKRFAQTPSGFRPDPKGGKR